MFNHVVGVLMVSCSVMELDPKKPAREDHNTDTIIRDTHEPIGE